MGEHAGLAPRDKPIARTASRHPIEAALADGDGVLRDGAQGSIVVAPDDLHKSNTSGGEPYEIAIPDSAPMKLLNERHDLYFVAYLRMVFRFGGFPGYQGIDVAVPAELATLRADLLPFLNSRSYAAKLARFASRRGVPSRRYRRFRATYPDAPRRSRCARSESSP